MRFRKGTACAWNENWLRADKEWKSLARHARAQALRGGIDQATIDRAVEQTRYGR